VAKAGVPAGTGTGDHAGPELDTAGSEVPAAGDVAGGTGVGLTEMPGVAVPLGLGE